MYIDDKIISSESRAEHLEPLRTFFSIFHQHHLVMNEEKCVPGKKSVTFLEHYRSLSLGLGRSMLMSPPPWESSRCCQPASRCTEIPRPRELLSAVLSRFSRGFQTACWLTPLPVRFLISCYPCDVPRLRGGQEAPLKRPMLAHTQPQLHSLNYIWWRHKLQLRMI